MDKIQSLVLVVKKIKAEGLRRRLRSLGLLNLELKAFSDESYVYFPILRSPSEHEVPELIEGDAFLKEVEFSPVLEKPRNLRDALRGILEDGLLQQAPRSFDIIGDVAVIELEGSLKPYARDVAMALKRVHKHLDTVLLKAGPSSGEYRVRDYEVIAGSGRTLTVHKEHGCRYMLDVRKAFFTPRLSGERLRVASQVKQGEVVIDMFAGVGPFSILIAKLQPRSKVYAFEINPDAYGFLVENIRLNGVEDRVIPVLGDVRQASVELECIADRLVMNLPFSSIDFLDVAVRLARPNAIIHIYVASKLEGIEGVSNLLLSKLRGLMCDVRIIFSRELKEVAPRTTVVAADVLVQRQSTKG